MCYNASVSAGTFLFVAAMSAYMWQRNRGSDRPLAIMLTFIAFMQVLEWGLWLNMDCGLVNKIISAIIPVYLMLQPVILNWVVGSYKAGWGIGYGTVAIVAAILLVPYQLYRAIKNYGDCSTLSEKGHIAWPCMPFDPFTSATYYAAVTYPFITLNNKPFAFVYLLFAYLSHTVFNGMDSKAWASMWCHFVNLLTVVAVLRPM